MELFFFSFGIMKMKSWKITPNLSLSYKSNKKAFICKLFGYFIRKQIEN